MQAKDAGINEQQAAAAFTKQSGLFDTFFSTNPIIQYKRERTRQVLQKYLHPGSHILELNSGTGEDATWIARHGHQVHATDLSAGMQSILREKVQQQKLGHRITSEICSFTALDSLQNKGPYDLIFSNFAGLNCTNDLTSVLHSFGHLLKPQGVIVLVIMPPVCLWELLLVFKGKFKTAFRRFSGRKGTLSYVEGVPFTCWYYKPGFVKRALEENYNLLGVEGLCTLVPPSYMDHFETRHPALYRFLQKKEDKLKSRWPWRNVGDYFIIAMERKRR